MHVRLEVNLTTFNGALLLPRRNAQEDYSCKHSLCVSFHCEANGTASMFKHECRVGCGVGSGGEYTVMHF